MSLTHNINRTNLRTIISHAMVGVGASVYVSFSDSARDFDIKFAVGEEEVDRVFDLLEGYAKLTKDALFAWCILDDGTICKLDVDFRVPEFAVNERFPRVDENWF